MGLLPNMSLAVAWHRLRVGPRIYAPHQEGVILGHSGPMKEAISLRSRTVFQTVLSLHDDVIKWKHLPRYWPFLRGIHRSR